MVLATQSIACVRSGRYKLRRKLKLKFLTLPRVWFVANPTGLIFSMQPGAGLRVEERKALELHNFRLSRIGICVTNLRSQA